jgi:hypothetical protein
MARTPVPPAIVSNNPLATRDHRADGAKGGKARAGRPPKLDDARFQMIVTSLKTGATRRSACEYAGVLPGSLHYLMASNQTAKLAVLQAEAHAEHRAVLKVVGSDDPRWSAWWLAHNPRTRDGWGEKPSRSTTIVGGQQNIAVQMPSFDQVLQKITAQRLKALEAERSRVIDITPRSLPTPEEHVAALEERRAEGPLPD